MGAYTTFLEVATFISALGTVVGFGATLFKAVTAGNRRGAGSYTSQQVYAAPQYASGRSARFGLFNYPRLALLSFIGYVLFYGAFVGFWLIDSFSSGGWGNVLLGSFLALVIGLVLIILAAIYLFIRTLLLGRFGWAVTVFPFFVCLLLPVPLFFALFGPRE